MIHNRNRVLGARVLAAMRDAAAARGRDHNALDRAFVARNRQHLDHVFVLAIAAQRQLHALIDDRALLIDAAAHRRLALRDDRLGDREQLVRLQIVLQRQLRHMAQDLVFQFLNVGIKQRHSMHPLLLPKFHLYHTTFARRTQQKTCAFLNLQV